MPRTVGGAVAKPVALSGELGLEIATSTGIRAAPTWAETANDDLDTAGTKTPWYRLCDNVQGPRQHTVQFTIVGVATSVTVRWEGTLDTDQNPSDESAFNMDDSGNDTTYTTDGRKMMHKANFPVAQVRGHLVSMSGAGAIISGMRYRGEL